MSLEELENTIRIFVQEQSCPNLVREDFELSQKEAEADEEEPDTELNPQPEPQNRTPEYEEWVECIHPPTPDDDAEDNSTQGSDGNYESEDYQVDHDWNTDAEDLNITDEMIRYLPNWLKETKAATEINYEVDVFRDVHILNEDQFRAFAIVAKYIHDVQDSLNPDQLLLNIHGSAGSGKTTWLKKVISYCNHILGPGIIKTCAPSGTAANLINGYTIHSLLNIYPSSKELPKISGKRLADLQKKFEKVKIICIDEKSMIGQMLFKQIDQRLRQATARQDKPFGGMSIILLGDWNQLPPVGDSPIYDSSKKVEVYRLYTLLSNVVKFKKVMRQEGEEQQQFREDLEKLYLGKTTLEQWERWATRDLQILSPEERHVFQSTALLACARKIDMVTHNKKKIIELNQPIAFIKSDSAPAVAKLPAADNDSGLPSNIILSKGTAVRLISNDWTEAGLTNGAMGIVRGIIYARNSHPPDLPAAVICTFPSYTGPPYLQNLPHSYAVTPITRKWQKGKTTCSRTMLPLIIGYALSIHRLQGKTCDKIILNPGPKEFSQGLLFTGVSRVKAFTDLAFSPMPYYQRFLQVKYPRRKQLEEQRLNELDQSTDVKYEETVRFFKNRFEM